MTTEESNKIIAEIERYYQINAFGLYSLRAKRYIKASFRKNGYLQFNLNMAGVKRTILAHRLVAMKFIPNPDNLSEVNHKDGNKLNNAVSNLDWVSREVNIQHGFDNKLITPPWEGKVGSAHSRSKPVLQLTISDELIAEHGSARQAAKVSGVDYGTISNVLIGLGKTAGGFKWKYKQ